MINQEEYELLKDLDDRLGWLARDVDGDLVVYEKKPEKSTRFWFDNGSMVNLGVIFDVGRLFQFIQWKDEEPYNIAELIEEYDKSQAYEIIESEEAEVKKDIEWLKGRFRGRKIFKPQNDREIGYNMAIDEFSEYVDQLDEPEVLSQELPAIPKFVADWIVDLKSKNIHLLDSIYDFTHGEDIHDYMRKHGDVLLRAWLDGFTLESERKYYAKIKGHELLSDREDCYWNIDKKELYIDNIWHDNSGYKTTKLTKNDWNNLGINDDNADFVKV